MKYICDKNTKTHKGMNNTVSFSEVNNILLSKTEQNLSYASGVIVALGTIFRDTPNVLQIAIISLLLVFTYMFIYTSNHEKRIDEAFDEKCSLFESKVKNG